VRLKLRTQNGMESEENIGMGMFITSQFVRGRNEMYVASLVLVATLLSIDHLGIVLWLTNNSATECDTCGKCCSNI